MTDLILNPSTKFIGQLTNRCTIKLHNDYNTYAMVRTGHYARDNIVDLAIACANWRVDGGENSTSIGTLTCSAAIEYPLGVYHRVYYNGLSSGSAPAGSTLWSDLTPIHIPKGELFWLRIRYTSTGNMPWTYGGTVNYKNSNVGDAMEETLTDKTTSGTISDTVFGSMMPTAIVGHTSMPSIGGIGDSRYAGEKDTIFDITGAQGSLERSFGLNYPTLNFGAPGEPAQAFTLANAPERIKLLKYTTHILCGLGINDINGGDSSTNIQGYLSLIYKIPEFGPREIIQNTLSPISSSTDGWTTTINQTTHANNADRVVVNDWIRASNRRHFDFADATESSRNSGLWTPNYTPDGLHESTAGNMSIGMLIPEDLISRGGFGFMPKSIY